VEAEAAFAPSRLPNEKLRPLTCRGLIMRTVSRSIIGPRVIVSRMHIVERLREWDFCTDSGAAALRAFHRQRPA
jgi:hypothetical protein